MPCGCQGSTYTPPGFTQSGQDAEPSTQQQVQDEAVLRGGPASEGYYHGPAPGSTVGSALIDPK